MVRVLICTHPITGHIVPALEIARALVARGHEVRCYTGQKFRARAEVVGAAFEPMRAAYDYDDADYDAAFPGRSRLKGLDQIKFDFQRVFIAPAPEQAQDLRAILAERPADVVLSDPGFIGAKILYRQGELPAWAVFNISVLGLPSRDVPPFGLGALPAYSPLGRLRTRLLYTLANRVVFRDVNAFLAATFRRVGLEPEHFAPFVSPMLYLQPSVPGFEYPRGDLPPSVHFIGALLPRPAGGFSPPPWWDDVTGATRPVVLVTQGTVATDPTELLLPTLRALAGEEVLVVATTGGKDLEGPLPDNARVARFIPFTELLPHVAAMVTNGGYGGATIALANGVPLVCAGTTEDKPEVGNRVAYAGAGLDLKTNHPPEARLRKAVRRVLADGAFRANARRLQAELARHDAPAEAAALLERLAATRQPVLNEASELAWAGRQRPAGGPAAPLSARGSG
ncbi:MAG TPA: nucleotide disphospho-sugar-binding domain-containing protein [Thermomicrobiales bacterium]|nr:nucleotide disphospho-sugar-binding domain-containing protein [Thermomicrobiales bacterium]